MLFQSIFLHTGDIFFHSSALLKEEMNCLGFITIGLVLLIGMDEIE